MDGRERDQARVHVDIGSQRSAKAEGLVPLRKPTSPNGREVGIRTDSPFAGKRDDVLEGPGHDHVAVDHDDDPGRLGQVCIRLRHDGMGFGCLGKGEHRCLLPQQFPFVRSQAGIQDDQLAGVPGQPQRVQERDCPREEAVGRDREVRHGRSDGHARAHAHRIGGRSRHLERTVASTRQNAGGEETHPENLQEGRTPVATRQDRGGRRRRR